MHDDFWHHAKQKKFVESISKSEIGPFMSVFHNFQTIAVEIDIPIKVHLEEREHRDLSLSMVLCAIRLLMECEVMFDWAARETGLLVLSWR